MKFICLKLDGRILQLEYHKSYDEILGEFGNIPWWTYETDMEVDYNGHDTIVWMVYNHWHDAAVGENGELGPVNEAKVWRSQYECPVHHHVWSFPSPTRTSEFTF